MKYTTTTNTNNNNNKIIWPDLGMPASEWQLIDEIVERQARAKKLRALKQEKPCDGACCRNESAEI